MKRTRKWQFIGQEAQRLAALGMSDSDIGRKLGVRQSTVSRWRQSGKLTRPAAEKGRRRASAKTVQQTPEQWAEAVREDYALDATDEQLVALAQQALALAHNMAETPATRLNAMGRFQAIRKDLSLGPARGTKDQPAPPAEKPAVSAPPRPARPAGDPRALFKVVSK
jgi:transcriptional regulator with XRE-family HTH domain